MLLPLDHVFRAVVRAGNLTVIDPAGTSYRYGDGSGIPVVARILDRATEWAILLDPQLALPEAYMKGRVRLEQGSCYDLLALLMGNVGTGRLPMANRLLEGPRRILRRLSQWNFQRRARANVRRHYDLDPRIYELFLDADKQYSCAYFPTPGLDIDAAQRAKKAHITAKLALRPGLKVLDIGCGWGGLALSIAEKTGADVTGITLSEEQLKIARERAWRSGLAKSVRFELKDYREINDRFDRIVSVGMFEHVGIAYYSTFFARVRELLSEDGVALLHTIGRTDGPGHTNPFIKRYIFPGGYFPALSEMLPAIERSGLMIADVEVLRLHYAETLKAWRERFLTRRAEAVAIAGEEFARMWEIYLAGSECAFRFQGLVVFQIQLVRKVDALPVTRDYIQEREHQLLKADGRDLPQTRAS